MPERFVVRVRDDAPLDVVCGLACGLATGLGAAMVRAEVQPGSSVVVVGAGGVGPGHDDGRAASGARPRSSPSTARRPRSTRRSSSGSPPTASTRRPTDPVAAVLELTAGRGADYGFDAAGVPGTLDQVLAATRPGATCVVIGRAMGAVDRHPRHHRAAAPARAHRHLRRLDPSSSSPPRVRRPVHRPGRLDLGAILDRRYTLDEAPQALDDLHHGRMTRGV